MHDGLGASESTLINLPISFTHFVYYRTTIENLMDFINPVFFSTNYELKLVQFT